MLTLKAKDVRPGDCLYIEHGEDEYEVFSVSYELVTRVEISSKRVEVETSPHRGVHLYDPDKDVMVAFQR